MAFHDFRNVATRAFELSFGWLQALLYACAKTVSGPSSSATREVIQAAQTVSEKLTSLSPRKLLE